MFVRYWMTRSPQAATEEMSLHEVLETMRYHRIRRLPVLRSQNLCGIIALSDFYRFVKPGALDPIPLTEELSELLLQYTVGDAMTPSPFTCEPNAPLEEVGKLMREKKVGALPVLMDGRLVGIITESDVLHALVSIAYSDASGKRVCFRIPDAEKGEILFRIVSLCQHYRLELLTLLTHPIQEGATLVMIRIRGEKGEDFIQSLLESEYRVMMIG